MGVVIATQNPMGLDHRALGNAGLWCVGRLQTDADTERVVEGLAAAGGAAERSGSRVVEDVIKRLATRWLLLRDANARGGSVLLQPRYAMSFLRGPMTRKELAQAHADRRCVHRSIHAHRRARGRPAGLPHRQVAPPKPRLRPSPSGRGGAWKKEVQMHSGVHGRVGPE